MSSGIFDGKQIALDLSFDVGFKKKCEIKNCITSNGGIISYIVTKKSSYVIVNDTDKIDISSKCRNAVKYGIPILHLEFLWKSVEAGQILNVEDFVVGGKSKKQDFKSGKISSSRSVSEKESKEKNVKIYNIKSCKVWKPDDANFPDFDEDEFEVAKYAVFHHEDIKKNINKFCCVEIHVQSTSEDHQYKYRVFTQSHNLDDKQETKESEEYRFTNISDEAVYMYKHIYNSFISKKYIPQRHNIPRNIGSRKVQRLIAEESVRKEDLSTDLKRLVDYIWLEATGQLEDILTISITDIQLQQIDKVEGVLLEIKKCLTDSDNNKMSSLLSEFYSILPHKTEDKDSIDKRWLSNKQDLCQLTRDMISVTEATNWSIRSSCEAKYRALRCHIQHLDSNNSQFNTIKDHILQSLDNKMKIEIQNIYEVHRPIEDDSFTHKLHPKQLLFHSSRVENFVGLLSRGLLLPKVVVDDYGGKRTDAGLLGSGIYFASSASKSARYSSASNVIGSRFMLVCEVALGNIYETTVHNTEFKQPPQGFNSVHGVSTVNSDFHDDEYVIYDTKQQRIQYLVEFIIDGDHHKTLDLTSTDIDTDIQSTSLLSQIDNIAINDIKDVENPLDKVKPGLISTGSDNPVELKSVHIKARLLDLAAQVIVLQEYYNSSTDSSIEAKYVFPLDDMAAVCGFEAFINGKHIIGEVKEKETARKEYKKAISEGHGAYLMDRDEETPDIFTVSVGNLPPGACVLIKITYVAELQVEGEEISFRLPGSVAPWKNDTAMKDITQSELDTFNVKQQMSTMQIAVEMPFDIVKLYSPTNRVLIKKTASKAVVRLCDDEQIGDGFQLLIGLNEIHVPRMWVEKTPTDSENRACMLTFYPEFEARENEDCEIIFILDLSNSMTGNGLEDAKKLIYLTLHHLSDKSEFNILVFGTGYEELFPCSVKPNESNLQIAKQFLKRLCADKGNTELYQPLHSLYLLPPTHTTRNIFLFSDGHINNDATVLNTASLHSQHSRIFTFAVSSSANVHFLRGLARVSGGSYEYFDRKTKSKWEGKIRDQLNKACQPSLTSVCVEWQQFDDNLPEPVQAPRKITALFNGSRQVVYGFVPNCTLATLKAVIEGEEISTVVSTPDLNITTGQILHRLTARSVIRDWEDGMLSSDKTQHEVIKKNLKDYIISISKEYSLVTQFTSFIAVEKRDEDEKDLQQGRGPQIIDLVNEENVDILSEISWPDEKPDVLIQTNKEIIDDGNFRSLNDGIDDDYMDDDVEEEPDDDDEENEDWSKSDSSSEGSSSSCSSPEVSMDEFKAGSSEILCTAAELVEDESDDDMGFDFFEELMDIGEKKLIEKEKLEKERGHPPSALMNVHDEIYDEIEVEEQSASFTSETAGKSIGGSIQPQSHQDTNASNITAAGVKKPHRFRPRESKYPELLEDRSLSDKKSTRTTQTARFSTGGKAPQPRAEEDKMATSDLFGSTFQQQEQQQQVKGVLKLFSNEEKPKSVLGESSYRNIADKITGKAVRDNINISSDGNDMDKDDANRPEVPKKTSFYGFGLSPNLGSGPVLTGNTLPSSQTYNGSFGSGAMFGGSSKPVMSSDAQFASRNSFSSSGFGAGRSDATIGGGGGGFSFGSGAMFGGSSKPVMSSDAQLANRSSFSSSGFGAGRSDATIGGRGGFSFGRGAMFGGSSKPVKSSDDQLANRSSFSSSGFGAGRSNATIGGGGGGISFGSGPLFVDSSSFGAGSAFFGGGSDATIGGGGFSFGSSAALVAPQSQSSKMMSLDQPTDSTENRSSSFVTEAPTRFFSLEDLEEKTQPLSDVAKSFTYLPSTKSASNKSIIQLDSPVSIAPVPSPPPPPGHSPVSVPPLAPIDSVAPPPPPPPPALSHSLSFVKSSGRSCLPPPALPRISGGFVPSLGRPRLPPPAPSVPMWKKKIAPLAKKSVQKLSEIQMEKKLTDGKVGQNILPSNSPSYSPTSPLSPKSKEITKDSLKQYELKAAEEERSAPSRTAEKLFRKSDERVMDEGPKRRYRLYVPDEHLSLKRQSSTRFSDGRGDDDHVREQRLKTRFSDVRGGDDDGVREQRSKTRFSDVRGDDDHVREQRIKTRFSDVRGDDDRVREQRSKTRFSDVRGDDDRVREQRSKPRSSDVRGDDDGVREQRSKTRFSDVRGDDDHVREQRSSTRFSDVRGYDDHVREQRSKTRFSDVSYDVDRIIEDTLETMFSEENIEEDKKKKKKVKVSEKYDKGRKVGIKAVSVYNDMTDITIDDSLTPCKKLKSDDLTCYGIGVNIPCVRKIDTALTTQACNQLITLQSKDGHWSYHNINVLEIDVFKCVDLMTKTGVKSLGEKVSDDIMDLIITLIAVLSILDVAWKQLPIRNRKKMIEDNNTWKSLIENVTMRSKILQTQDPALLSCVEKGIGFYKIINDKYPLVYYTLELGDDWITIVTKMLRLSL